jgi:two-component system, LytTR family, sensor histidine kinase AlgZ
MHPVLGQIRRLALYLTAWVPFAGLLYYLFTAFGGMTRYEAEVLVPLLCIIYAFDCLSAWYTCKATPIETSGALRLLSTHLLSAGIMSALWVLIARGIARLLASSASFAQLPEHVSRNASLLFGTGVMLYLLSVGLHYVLLALQQSQVAAERLHVAELLARDAELRALKTQINPHFLFNSLHSISALTSIDASRARDMCVALADFLRLTLGMGEKTVISLEEELALLRKYLAVEQIRFGSRLLMQEDIDKEALAFSVPPLLLQPLIENAVTHGVANLPQGGWIKLQVNRNGVENHLHISVANNYDPEMPPRRRNGVGLVNVRQRMDARYGPRAQFAVNKIDDRFEVQLDIPAEIMVHP